jgi:hypothetical protein
MFCKGRAKNDDGQRYPYPHLSQQQQLQQQAAAAAVLV